MGHVLQTWRDRSKGRRIDRDHIRVLASYVKELRLPDAIAYMQVGKGIYECLFNGLLVPGNSRPFFPKLEKVITTQYGERTYPRTEFRYLAAFALRHIPTLRHIQIRGLEYRELLLAESLLSQWPKAWQSTLRVLHVEDISPCDLDEIARLENLEALSITDQMRSLIGVSAERMLSTKLKAVRAYSSLSDLFAILMIIPSASCKELDIAVLQKYFDTSRNISSGGGSEDVDVEEIIKPFTAGSQSDLRSFSLTLMLDVHFRHCAICAVTLKPLQALSKLRVLRVDSTSDEITLDNASLLELVPGWKCLEVLVILGRRFIQSHVTLDVLPALITELKHLQTLEMGFSVPEVPAIPPSSVDSRRQLNLRIEPRCSSDLNHIGTRDFVGIARFLLHTSPGENQNVQLTYEPVETSLSLWVEVVREFRERQRLFHGKA
ncbi:hypothetical protein K523DRAFT_358774 [Schizophyllum commune Tattone D]|nr:hypothetical protein K523DRAFT_358774 [Schizophyllum commune Tattone D]